MSQAVLVGLNIRLSALSISPLFRTRAINMSSSPGVAKSTENSIIQNLQDAFNPTFLEVVNESYKHNVPKGAESHFKVTVVSESFAGKALLARHRMVNTALAAQLNPSFGAAGGSGGGGNGIHALSIQAKTPAQYAMELEKGNASHSTPPCLGGSTA